MRPPSSRLQDSSRSLVQMPLGTRLLVAALPLVMLWLLVLWAIGTP
jgi:hypothetical protein